MKIFTIVVCYNGLQNGWIQKCLESLLNSELSCEIILIDNNSRDNSIEVIKSNYRGITLIESDKNIGFGKANNIGISKAIKEGADYIFLLNQDAYVDRDSIRSLVSLAQVNKGFGILSPIHLNGTGSNLDNNFSNYLSHYNCPDFLSDLFFKRLNPLYEINFVNAAAWLIRKDCLNTVGGFNPIFFMYGEDDNYIDRVHYHGFKVGVVTDSYIYHDREGRGNDNRDYQFISQLKEYSNPNNNRKIEEDKIAIKRQILKNRFLLRFGRVKYFRNKVERLNEFPQNLTLNKILSQEKGRTFL